ncbi:MAG: hypothetical protein SP1CHLAM54_06710 [Chlamydiia bacterium]|nr:hypothetical protein [Chlamydiia bacterium]MCH9615580.1 hypothetical protein [Chlamydiia bacterium]MCH9629235.1 hypothetical protein [Chlamydiia bacterium]
MSQIHGLGGITPQGGDTSQEAFATIEKNVQILSEGHAPQNASVLIADIKNAIPHLSIGIDKQAPHFAMDVAAYLQQPKGTTSALGKLINGQPGDKGYPQTFAMAIQCEIFPKYLQETTKNLISDLKLVVKSPSQGLLKYGEICRGFSILGSTQGVEAPKPFMDDLHNFMMNSSADPSNIYKYTHPTMKYDGKVYAGLSQNILNELEGTS